MDNAAEYSRGPRSAASPPFGVRRVVLSGDGASPTPADRMRVCRCRSRGDRFQRRRASGGRASGRAVRARPRAGSPPACGPPIAVSPSCAGPPSRSGDHGRPRRDRDRARPVSTVTSRRLLMAAIPGRDRGRDRRLGPVPPTRIGGSCRVRLAHRPGGPRRRGRRGGPGRRVDADIPPAAPLVFLAMAFAAMTPGYPIAAAFMAGASARSWSRTGRSTQGVGLDDELSDEFVVGAIVILIASAGMAVVVRSRDRGRDPRDPARRRAARTRRRARDAQPDRRPGSMARSPSTTVVQDVIDDIAREFEITLASIYLPISAERAVDGRRGRLSPPVPRDRRRRRDHRPGRRDATDAVRRGRPQRPRLPRRPGRRPDRGGRAGRPRRRAARASSTSRARSERPIGPAQVALAEMVAQSLSAALRSARLDDERRDRLHAIERVLAVSRSLVADLDRPRIVASIVDAVADLLAADLVGLFTRRVDGVYELEAGVGVRDGAIGSAAPPGLGVARALRCRTGEGRRIARARSWPIAVGRSGAPEGAPHSAHGPADRRGRRHGGRPAREP